MHHVLDADAQTARRHRGLDDERSAGALKRRLPIELRRLNDGPSRGGHARELEGALHVNLGRCQIVKRAIRSRVRDPGAFECIDDGESRNTLQLVAVTEIDHAGDARVLHLFDGRFNGGQFDGLPVPRQPECVERACELVAPLFEVAVILQMIVGRGHGGHQHPDGCRRGCRCRGRRGRNHGGQLLAERNEGKLHVCEG